MAKNRINIAIGANLKKFSSDMQNVKREMRKTSRKMKSLGQSMTRSLTVPLSLIGVASVKLAADFEQSMAKVKAVSGATGAEFKALNDNALELGRTTRYTAQQVAELQLNLSKLGFKPKEITQSTEAILNLALASGEDLAQSATVAANTMRGFGIATSESGRVADVMAKSFSSSGLDLEKFSVSMSKIAPIAKAAGFGFEQTVAMMSALADAGVEASTIGTSLRRIFIELSTKGMSFGDAMEQIRNSTNKTKTATDLFQKQGAAAAIILAENETKLSDLSTAYLNAEGSAKAMAKTMDDTLMGAFLRLKSALEGAALDIGKSLRPAIDVLTGFVTKLADGFSSLSDEAKTFITVAGVILAAVGPLLTIFGRLLGVMSKSSMAIVGLGRSLALLGGPIGITIALFGSLALAIYKYVKSKEKVSAVSKTVIQDIHTERTEMNSLFTALKHTKEGTDARRVAIEELNSKYGDYLPNQITEKDNLDDIAKAQKAANDQLTASIVLKSKANDIEKANAKYIEDTKKAMSQLSKETANAKTQASGFTRAVSEQQAKAFEIGVLGIVEKLKDTSSQEAYATSIRQIMIEVNALSKEQGIAIGNYRKFRNSILGLVNAEVDRNNSLIEVNSEYKKLSKTLGIVINQTNQLNAGTGNAATPLGGDGPTSTPQIDLAKKEIDDLNLMYNGLSHSWDENEIIEKIRKLGDETSKATKKAKVEATEFQQSMMSAAQALRDGILNLGMEAFEGFFEAVGRSLAKQENVFDGFGKQILQNVAAFMSQFGKLLVAGAIASEAMQKMLFTNPVAAAVAGVALIAIAGTIKGMTSQNPTEFGGGQSSYIPPSTGGGSSYYGTSNDVLTLETVVYGRDIVLSSNRQHGTISRTRRK